MVTNTFSPGLGSLALGGVVLTVLLYRQRPPVTTATVFALVPWLLVGSALYVLRALGTFPQEISALFVVSGAYLTAFLFSGLVWSLLLELSAFNRSVEEIPYYLGAMGAGVVVVLLSVIVWQGTVTRSGAVWLFVILATSVTIAAVTPFLVGLWYPDVAFYTSLTGGLLVFGYTLRGLTRAVGATTIESIGHTRMSRAVQETVFSYPTADYLGFGPELVWPAAFVLIHVFIAVVIVATLAPYVRTARTKGNALIGIAAAAGLIPGTVNLLLITVGA